MATFSALLMLQNSLLTSRQQMTDVVSETNDHHKKLKKTATTPDSNTLSSKLAWLITYPNSGTTFTLSLLESVTNYSTATNYMVDHKVLPRPIFPVYRNQPKGPFYRRTLPLPNTTVLVKSHCHSNVPLPGELDGIENFVHGCSETKLLGKLGGTIIKHYNISLVDKVVHLIRNPFDNLIANFHHANKNASDSPEAFRRECFAQRHHQQQQDIKRRMANDASDVSSLPGDYNNHVYKAFLPGSPCYNRLVSYITWHNNAFQLPAFLGGIQSLVLYYEDYERDLEGTTQKLLEFLDLSIQGELLPFRPRHYNDDYFFAKERQSIKALARQMASVETWNAIERYFE